MNKRLLKYFAGTMARMALLVLSASMLSFFLVTASPMNAVDAFLNEVHVSEEQRARIEAEWDLDKPPVERYLLWAKKAVQGDLGKSVAYSRPVSQILSERFKASLLLMGSAWARGVSLISKKVSS